MARRAVIPDTDTEEIAGLLNTHALGTNERPLSRPGSKWRSQRANSPEAGPPSKRRKIGAHGNRRPNGNVANNAVKRAPEHGRLLRSATRSVEPQAVPKRKRNAGILEMEDDIEESAEELDEEGASEGGSSRLPEPATPTPKKKHTARPSERMRSHGEAQAASGEEQTPQNSRPSLAGLEGQSERRYPVAIQSSEATSQSNRGEVRDTVEEETAESEATGRVEIDAPLELDNKALKTKMLLGNEGLWEMIIEASTANRERSKNNTELKSNIVRNLVEKLTETRQVYHDLAADDLAGEDVDETEADLETGLNEIMNTVDNLSKPSPGRQATRVIYESYMNGVTQFVSLLKDAMKGRVLKTSPKAYDLAGLEEVIFIQEMFLRLLEELHSWKVSSDGFTRNVQQRIKPHLRTMLCNFKKHLARDLVAEQRRINRGITASQASREIVSPRVQQERKAARHEEIQRRVLISVEEESLRWGGDLRLVKEVRGQKLPEAPSVRAAGTRSKIWTEQEDTALIHELLNNKETRGLPVDERYRMILNNELLSNKLPDHVEERAMWHKPYLVQQMKDDYKGRVPRWVDSIRRTAR